MKRAFLLIHRLLFSGLFVWAGVQKLWQVDRFAQDLEHYRLLPPSLVVMLAWWLPCMELVVAVGLWVPKYRRGAVLLTALLSLGFVVFVGSAWWRGLDISCGCFGAHSGRIGAWELCRTLVLGALAGTALWFVSREPLDAPVVATAKKAS